MNPAIFREYDIRGVADRDLTDEVTRRIGAGLARLLRPASCLTFWPSTKNNR